MLKQEAGVINVRTQPQGENEKWSEIISGLNAAECRNSDGCGDNDPLRVLRLSVSEPMRWHSTRLNAKRKYLSLRDKLRLQEP